MSHIVYKRTSYDVSKFENEAEFEKAMRPKFSFREYKKVLEIFKKQNIGSTSKGDKKKVTKKPKADSKQSGIPIHKGES